MAHILCINPWIYDFAAYGYWIEPLGLLTVASLVRRAGHEVALLDCLDRHHPKAPAPRSKHDRYGRGPFSKTRVNKPAILAHVPRHWSRYGLPVDAFEAELRERPRPDAVLVTSMMTYWYPGPFEAIRRVKAYWPGVPVALGGVYATLCSDHARACSGADAVFEGPGGDQVLAWIDQVTDGKTTRSPATRGPAGLADSAMSFPAHDLRRGQGFVTVITASGCPFHCPYCAVRQLWPMPFSPRPPAQVVDEIAWCVESLGAQDIVFYDDALLFDAEQHIHPILDEVIARRLPARFHTPNGLHARFIDRSLAHKMRQAGFVTLFLGLESADPTQQQHDGSKINRAQFADAVEALFAAGFSARDTAAYVLIARPGQDLASVRDTIAFAYRLGIPVSPTQYTPIPGTSEWQRAVAAGYIAADADPLLHNNSIYPCADMPPWEALKQQVREQNRRLVTA